MYILPLNHRFGTTKTFTGNNDLLCWRNGPKLVSICFVTCLVKMDGGNLMKLSESITLDKRTIGNTCKSGSAFKVFGEGETPNPLARVQDLLRISRLKKNTKKKHICMQDHDI